MQNALSPLDGRYEEKLKPLHSFFSEEALMRFRVLVEEKWLRFLSDRDDISALRKLTKGEHEFLQKIVSSFSEDDALHIKEIEKTTNHDVKAVEYFLKEKVKDTSLADISEWIHFSLTSEDVNNLAYALLLRDAIQKTLLPLLQKAEKEIQARARQWKAVSLLSRTHGQPASPTTMGKEFLIFSARLQRQLQQLEKQEFLGKLSGASGNFNAHVIAFPEIDWLELSESFVTSLGLTWNPIVPQIEPHDFLAEISHLFLRMGNIFLDASRDIWGYISLGFFRQQLKEGEVGSSAMPHKVNPIDFENAEGNIGIANALFTHFAEKLPVSRWQRDLSDSTVLRNMGVAFGHNFLAIQSFLRGLEKLTLDEKTIYNDLAAHPEVLAEAMQTILRARGAENPYERLKDLTRGKEITLESFYDFVQTQKDLSEEDRVRLLSLTPKLYTGIAEIIVDRFLSDANT